jgi:hypothetical protein
MGIDHCCADIAVAQEFLNGANIVAELDESGCERVAECMAAAVFRYAGAENGEFDRSLDGCLIDMGTEVFLRIRQENAVGGGEEELPWKFPGGRGIFPLVGEGERSAGVVGDEVLVVELTNGFNLMSEEGDRGFGEES